MTGRHRAAAFPNGEAHDRRDEDHDGEGQVSLRAVAVRLAPRVDWARMSDTAVLRALGCRPADCAERGEYEAGRAAARAGEAAAPGATLSYRAGYRCGGLGRRGRRRRRRRALAGCEEAGR